jgi:hypothetical protein
MLLLVVLLCPLLLVTPLLGLLSLLGLFAPAPCLLVPALLLSLLSTEALLAVLLFALLALLVA